MRAVSSPVAASAICFFTESRTGLPWSAGSGSPCKRLLPVLEDGALMNPDKKHLLKQKITEPGGAWGAGPASNWINRRQNARRKAQAKKFCMDFFNKLKTRRACGPSGFRVKAYSSSPLRSNSRSSPQPGQRMEPSPSVSSSKLISSPQPGQVTSYRTPS